MFRSLFQEHLQGSSFVLSAPTTFQLHASSFVCIGMWSYALYCMCIQCTCLCAVWSFHDPTTTNSTAITTLQRYNQRFCYCSCSAPDNGREDALNMLSCTYE
jgi:hypothetical protein